MNQLQEWRLMYRFELTKAIVTGLLPVDFHPSTSTAKSVVDFADALCDLLLDNPLIQGIQPNKPDKEDL